jgi:hypothetical protein
MNGESTYQPNFVIDEEDKTSAEQKEFEESLKSIPPTIAVKDKVSNKLINREVEFIEGQRRKLRLFDPKGVYFYRHVTISYFQSVSHFITLLISCCVIFLLLELGYSESQTLVKGIGWVSNITLIEQMTYYFIVFFIVYQMRKLFKLQGVNRLKSYKLAMLANSLNLTMINFLKVIFILCTLLIFTLMVVTPNENIDVLLLKLSNGVIGDVMNISISFIGIVTIVRGFRFCNKGLTE